MKKEMKSEEDFPFLNVEKMFEEEEEEEWEEIGSYSEIWRASKAGEVLEGGIVEIRDGTYGTEAIIENKTGARLQTPAHVILQRKIEQLAVGDWVKILYQGRRVTLSGRRVEDYRVMRKWKTETSIL